MMGEAGGPGQPGQSVQGEAGGPGQPGQSMKGEAGGPGQPGQSMKEAGAAGGPGKPANAKEADAGASGGPGAGKNAKPEAELKAGEAKPGKDGAVLKDGESTRKGEDAGASGGPAAKQGASGGPGAKKDEDEDLVDPDADRPNFGSGTDENGEDDADDAFAAVAARAKGDKGKAAKKKKAERKPIDPAYVTVAIMGLAVISLAGLIWLGRGILLEMWPGISGFYKSMGVEAARPGEGLKIAEPSKRLQRIGGVETLVVRGFISNISELPKTVPNLRLELYNEKKEVIQDSSAPAPAGVLDPGASVGFDIRMELPQLSAAKGGYAVVWEE